MTLSTHARRWTFGITAAAGMAVLIGLGSAAMASTNSAPSVTVTAVASATPAPVASAAATPVASAAAIPVASAATTNLRCALARDVVSNKTFSEALKADQAAIVLAFRAGTLTGLQAGVQLQEKVRAGDYGVADQTIAKIMASEVKKISAYGEAIIKKYKIVDGDDQAQFAAAIANDPTEICLSPGE